MHIYQMFSSFCSDSCRGWRIIHTLKYRRVWNGSKWFNKRSKTQKLTCDYLPKKKVKQNKNIVNMLYRWRKQKILMYERAARTRTRRDQWYRLRLGHWWTFLLVFCHGNQSHKEGNWLWHMSWVGCCFHCQPKSHQKWNNMELVVHHLHKLACMLTIQNHKPKHTSTMYKFEKTLCGTGNG